MCHPRCLVVLLAVLAVTEETSASERCFCDGAITDCSRLRMPDVRESDFCTNSTTMDLHANSLAVFPDVLQRFRVILAPDNRFSRLPRTGQLGHALRILDLSRNQITNSSHEFRTLPQLRVLRLKRNYLTTLDFIPQPCGLYVLDASDNSVSNMEGPTQNCGKLVFLSLSKNQIGSVGVGMFVKMKKLRDLFLDSNMIQTISEGAFAGLQNLRTLSLSRNRLTHIAPLGTLPRLQRLDLSVNVLAALPEALLQGTPHIEVFALHANRLEILPATIFRRKHMLRELQVWKNRLTEVPDLHDCCERLQVANFDTNNLSSSGQEANALLSAKIKARLENIRVIHSLNEDIT